MAHRAATSVVLQTSHCWKDATLSSGLVIIQNESDSTELIGRRSTSHVCGFVQELIHGQFDLQGAPAVMQERPPVCVTDCKSLYDHLSAVCSPSTLHDKRSAIDVLVIRESVKKTGCTMRRAPRELQLADGLTKDKGEAVECLRRSLRSGSCMLRGEEQVMH